MEITAWPQQHLQKLLSVNTVYPVIHKCRLKLYREKKKIKSYVIMITYDNTVVYSVPKLI